MKGYQSHADLGGEDTHGRVILEPEGELFHAPWERQALALTLAMGATGAWNLDMSRSARETLPDYRSLSYYQIWIRALEKLLIERGLVGPDEIAAGRMLHPARLGLALLRAADVPATLAQGSPTRRPALVPARFAAGEPVRLRAAAVAHHTRLPGYARERSATLTSCAAFTCSRMHTRKDWASGPAGSTRSFSAVVSCGVMRPRRATACRSTPGSRIWSLCHERPAGRFHRPAAR